MQGSVSDSDVKQVVAAAPTTAVAVALIRGESLEAAVLFLRSRRRRPRRPRRLTAEAAAIPATPVRFGVRFLVRGSRRDPGKMSRRHFVVRFCRRRRRAATPCINGVRDRSDLNDPKPFLTCDSPTIKGVP